MAVILARPEGPVPEQERLCAAQILACLSLWTGCFLLQHWEDPTGREEPQLATYLSQTVGGGVGGGRYLCALLVKLNIFDKVGKHVVPVDRHWSMGSG